MEIFLSIILRNGDAEYKNVTKAHADKMVSSEWVKFQFWVSYPFQFTSTLPSTSSFVSQVFSDIFFFSFFILPLSLLPYRSLCARPHTVSLSRARHCEQTLAVSKEWSQLMHSKHWPAKPDMHNVKEWCLVPVLPPILQGINTSLPPCLPPSSSKPYTPIRPMVCTAKAAGACVCKHRTRICCFPGRYLNHPRGLLSRREG